MFDHVGRRRIYTDVKLIDKSNVLEVLEKAFAKHCANVMDMDFLLDYEAGVHPKIRDRKKKIRPEVDYKVVDNIAHYVTVFRTGYFWGSDYIYIQRGSDEIHGTDTIEDNLGIAGLNEMIANGNDISAKRQRIGDFVEKVGVGYSLVDVKSKDEFEGSIINENGNFIDSPCHIYDLDPRFTFIVYHNGVGHKSIMGVSFVLHQDSSKHFTCYTANEIFEIESNEIKSVTPNFLRMIPITEYDRSPDMAGCFEHCIDDMDALDILSSDAANDSTQRTQDIWWGHNISLEDENGEQHTPESGEWVLTYTPQGLDNRADAKISPLASTYDGASAQSQIYRKFNHILQKCFVPIQSETSGGGSTGSAMDMSSGWSAMELDALREEGMIKHAARNELKLILRAIKYVPDEILPADSPVRKLHHTDIDTHFPRRRNYDLSVKANALATLLGRGVYPPHCLKAVEIFPDNEQVWRDSMEMMIEYQKKVCIQQPTQSGGEATDSEKVMGADDRILQDSSDQTANSPIIGGFLK